MKNSNVLGMLTDCASRAARAVHRRTTYYIDGDRLVGPHFAHAAGNSTVKKQRSKTKYWRLLCYLLIGFVSLNVFFAAYVQPLDHDGSFNLQVAKSLANNFVYQSTYYPRYIYDGCVTTNGFIQYLAALDFRLFGDRLGLAITLALITTFPLIACLRYSLKTFAAFVVLMISYPLFVVLMTSFWGEIAALGFLMLGASFTRLKLRNSQSSPGLFSNTVGSAICYGLAISTKLIVAIALPLILFGLFYTSRRFDKILFVTAIRNTVSTYLLSMIVFILVFYVSVFHSEVFLVIFGQSVSDFVSDPGLLKFIEGHFSQAREHIGFSTMLSFDAFDSGWLLPLFFASLALLVYASLGWVPFAISVIILLTIGGLNDRRLFLFIIPGILLAADYTFCEAGRFFQAVRKYRYNVVSIVLNIIVLSIWIYALVYSDSPAGLAAQLDSPFTLLKTKFDSAKHSLEQLAQGNNNFVVTQSEIDVAEAIKRANAPVITSGWWQFPALQLFSKTSYYDRMDPSVPSHLQGTHPLLLIDPANKAWPETSVQMCTRIIIETPDHVLCYYDMKLPLNYRWGID